jgi:hypothetical protein
MWVFHKGAPGFRKLSDTRIGWPIARLNPIFAGEHGSTMVGASDAGAVLLSLRFPWQWRSEIAIAHRGEPA